MEEERYWFEDVPDDQRYWFLVQWGPTLRQEAAQAGDVFSPEQQAELKDIEADVRHEKVFGVAPDEARKLLEETDELLRRMDAVEFAPHALSPLFWMEAECREIYEDKEVPCIYTTRAAAEEVRRQTEDAEPGMYLGMVERYGQELTDEAYSNTSPLRSVWMDRSTLLDKLAEADFDYLAVDGKFMRCNDLIEELLNLEEG